ncbi:LysR family transcriptional regulator [Methylobacterium terricola]|uniref:LysR family transcriptional regulator n=2 Tax=Methylobacterium terricola TaxID=2583531 RepID=A0A5C4L788_9HYPH|nr:LysR family transcriptional regulator [Methylobacterium terricola]
MAARKAALVSEITESDLRLLRIFRAVAESGGLSAAEARLRMERSTISRHVQTLETRLGGAVCLRGPAGFELTELGRAALQAAITACDTLDQVRDQLNSTHDVVIGQLALGLADNCLTNSDAKITEAIRQFRLRAPAVQLHISVRPPVDLAADLLTRRLHMAIGGPSLADPRLETHWLFNEEAKLYTAAPVDPKADAAALVGRGYAVVTRDRDRHSLALANRLGAERCVVALGLEAVATLLAAGNCIGFLPTHLARSLSQSKPLVEVPQSEEWSYGFDFSLIHGVARPLSRAGHLMKDILLAAHAADASSADPGRARSGS